MLRYADAKDLLVSGLLEGGKEIAEHAAVIDVPVERGHIVLFSNNPVWRGETHGSYPLVWNAILNWDALGTGRRDAGNVTLDPPVIPARADSGGQSATSTARTGAASRSDSRSGRAIRR